MSRLYFDFKVKIKEEIKEKFGTMGNFLDCNKDLHLKLSDLSTHLNPQKNTSLATLKPILDKLDFELWPRRKQVRPVIIQKKN